MLIAMLSPARAEDATTTPAAKTAPVPRILHKPQATHPRIGEDGTTPTAYVAPKKTRQEIADEKKLQRDMHICDGC